MSYFNNLVFAVMSWLITLKCAVVISEYIKGEECQTTYIAIKILCVAIVTWQACDIFTIKYFKIPHKVSSYTEIVYRNTCHDTSHSISTTVCVVRLSFSFVLLVKWRNLN